MPLAHVICISELKDSVRLLNKVARTLATIVEDNIACGKDDLVSLLKDDVQLHKSVQQYICRRQFVDGLAPTPDDITREDHLDLQAAYNENLPYLMGIFCKEKVTPMEAPTGYVGPSTMINGRR